LVLALSLWQRKVSNNCKVIPILIGAVVASVLFGVYHFAHSPPFNEFNMVLFLMIPAMAPSVVYFVGRDIYVAIIIQNFLGIFGIMQTINLQAYSQP
jgi:membrane protease YdiL (CAAX protease family)